MLVRLAGRPLWNVVQALAVVCFNRCLSLQAQQDEIRDRLRPDAKTDAHVLRSYPFPPGSPQPQSPARVARTVNHSAVNNGRLLQRLLQEMDFTGSILWKLGP